MRQRLNELIARLDARNVRERVLLLLTGVVVIVSVADLAIIRGLRADLDRVAQQKTELRQGRADARAQIEELGQELKTDPNAELRERIAKLKPRLKAVDERLAEQQSELIEPADMVTVLRRLVEQDDALELVSVQSEPATVVERFATGDAKSGDDVPGRVYRHGVRLVLEGSFSEALAYLRTVDDLSWRLFWQRLDIQVVDYPMTRIRLRLHTLSLDEDWIGV